MLKYYTRLKLGTLATLKAMILTSGGYGAVVEAASAQAQSGFRYDTSAWTSVDIDFPSADGSPALLSFYSEGPNGLRLLENAFTDTHGHYAGDMRLPAHLAKVVVVVRTAGHEDTLTLPINDHSIAYAE
jgi:hypothetical protein